MTDETFKSFQEAAAFAKKFAVATGHPFVVVPADVGWMVVASSNKDEVEDNNIAPDKSEGEALAAEYFLLGVYGGEELPAEVM